MRMLDRQIRGLFVSRAAASEAQPGEFQDFLDSHIETLQRLSEEYAKARSRLEKAPIDENWYNSQLWASIKAASM